MKQKVGTISQKITLLNKTILDSMTEKDMSAIVKNFTESGIKILEADFGFAWWKFSDSKEYKLAYKSPSTPYEPTLPRPKASNYMALKTKKPFFDSNVRKENYKLSNIFPYVKSFIVIPIYHDNYIYGNIVLCYRERHAFTEEELTLAQAIGHTTAQAITIHKFIKTNALLREEKLKTEFIANVTHELQTPLAIMKGNVDLALTKNGGLKSAHSALKKVNAEINVLSNLLKDMALLTSASSGQNVSYTMNPMPVNITKLIIDLAKRLGMVASKKNIKIKVKNSKIGDLFVAGDHKHLAKLFVNIIKNAITYGKNSGNIAIDLDIKSDIVKVKISDDGVGISKEDLPKIFDRFYRGDKAHTHDTHGTHSGLGLAIAKWVTEIHGGKIKVESMQGKKSVFTVTLPRLKKRELDAIRASQEKFLRKIIAKKADSKP